MNLGEKLFGQRSGEPDAAYQKRLAETKRIFTDALNHAAGHKLLNLLANASHPCAPRFYAGATPEQAAFLDGEKHLIGLLYLNGTANALPGQTGENL